MTVSIELLRVGVRGALEARQRAGFCNDEPVCVYDLADRLGVEVKFCAGKSFGGMYTKSSKTVLIPTLRPPGRQAFTCAHELGHWFFEHGSRLDDPNVMERGSDDDPQEQLAHTFASHLLMPSWAVKKAFGQRKLDPERSSPLQIYTVATQLGVGYTTLIYHLLYALQLLSHGRAKVLLRSSPRDIRAELLGHTNVRHLIVADACWTGVPIDMQVDDMAILPLCARPEGRAAKIVGEHSLGVVIQAQRPGISRFEQTDEKWAVFVRVSRKNYEGRSRYRHLEDPDAD